MSRRYGRNGSIIAIVIALLAIFFAPKKATRHDDFPQSPRATGRQLQPAPAPTSPPVAAQREAPKSADAHGDKDLDLSGIRSEERAAIERVVSLIDAGGPFEYERDGIVFKNAERRLPAHDRGYYHEYTVPTPGARNRGARRIIAGGGGELFYTNDHYRSFVQIRTGS